MRFESTGMWAAGIDGYFYDDYPSREEAIKGAKESELADVGQVYDLRFTEEDLLYEFDDVFDVLAETVYYEVGDACEYEVSDKHQNDLAVLLAKTAIDYINEHKLQPKFYVVKNIEEVENE